MGDKFLRVSWGFANRVIYFRVPQSDVDAANRHFENFSDENPGCHAEWVSGQGLGDRPIMWADRAYVGL